MLLELETNIEMDLDTYDWYYRIIKLTARNLYFHERNLHT